MYLCCKKYNVQGELEMINVFMVDHNESTIREVKKYFSSLSSICIKKSFMDGKDAINELLNNPNNYDVVLMNPILPSLDGMGILKKMRENKLNQKVIIYADFFNKDMIKCLADFNISFYLFRCVTHDKKFCIFYFKRNNERFIIFFFP